MYAVTGATGKLGSQVVAALRGIVAPEEIVALARDPGKAADMTAAGVQVRRFDYDEPGGMKAALADVTRLLFVSSSAPDRLGQHRAVVEAAAQVAPALIAYTSVIHADVNPMPLAESHRETERMIVESGLPHAILRNSWYVENYLIGAEAAVGRGALFGSAGDGRISAATRADYAAAAVAVLTGEIAGNRVYELAGDEAFTLADVAAALGDAAGREVVYRNMPEAAYRDALVAEGMPSGFAAAMAQYSALSAGDVLADGSRTLSALVGRPTESMRSVIQRAIRR